MDSNRTQTTTDIWMFSRDVARRGGAWSATTVEAIDGVDRQGRRGDERRRRQLHRRRHRPVDLRQEGAAPGRRDRRASTSTTRRSTSAARRTRSRTRPSSTRPLTATTRPTAASSAATTAGSSSADQQRRAVQVGRPSLVLDLLRGRGRAGQSHASLRLAARNARRAARARPRRGSIRGTGRT